MIPWTFTFLNDFDNCARKAQHKYVLKDLPREEKSDAQTWGIRVHKAFDLRLRAPKSNPLPQDMTQYEPLVVGVERAADGKTLESEKRMAIDAGGSPVDFFGNGVWGRGVCDVAIHADNTAFLFDWKTGKRREDPQELRVQALLLKCAYPGIKQAYGAYGWLKDNKMGEVHDLGNFAATFNGIKATMKVIEGLPANKEWPANPNPLCGWCPVKTCEHNPQH